MNRTEFMNIVKKNIKEVNEDEIYMRAETLKNIIDVAAKQELEEIKLAKKVS